jgi:hypothetical protein
VVEHKQIRSAEVNKKEYLEASSAARRAGLDPMGPHREYYAQFVDEWTKAHVLRGIGIDALLASTDPYLNDIPLDEWDALFVADRWASPLSLGWVVCVAKEAARQLIEEEAASH